MCFQRTRQKTFSHSSPARSGEEAAAMALAPASTSIYEDWCLQWLGKKIYPSAHYIPFIRTTLPPPARFLRVPKEEETPVYGNVPQLIKVLPMNSFVSGFQTKRRKFSIRSLQVFFSFKVAILSPNFPQTRPPPKPRNTRGAQTVAQGNSFGFYTFCSAEGQRDYFLDQWKPLPTAINPQQIQFFISSADNDWVARLPQESWLLSNALLLSLGHLRRSAELRILQSAFRARDILGVIAVI